MFHGEFKDEIKRYLFVNKKNEIKKKIRAMRASEKQKRKISSIVNGQLSRTKAKIIQTNPSVRQPRVERAQINRVITRTNKPSEMSKKMSCE